MMWVNYNIAQVGQNFRVEGEWPGEVMGLTKDGSQKPHWLYKPGDVFRVDDKGWLCKIHEKDGVVRDE